MGKDGTSAEMIQHVDNDTVRVTEWRFEPGAATGFHTHEMDYVIVALADGRLRLTDASGTSSETELSTGQSYFRKAGVQHDVVNAGSRAFAFVEIEIKPR